MKILYTITKANWGGAQRYVFDLASAMKDEGHEVVVFSGEPGLLTKRLEEAGITVVTSTFLGKEISLAREINAFRELYAYVQTFRPDVIHANSSKAGLALLAGRLLRVKRLIFTVHGFAFNEERPWYARIALWKVYYLTFILATHIICVSHALKRQAHYMLGTNYKTRVIHNGIAPFPLQSPVDARIALIPKVPDGRYIGTIAELHPIKQLDVLIRSWKDVRAHVPEANLLILGEGEDRSRLEGIIHELGLHESVYLLGHISEASSYLSLFELFVLPSRSEGLGYVVLEAGLAHVPVVATRVGGIPEIISKHSLGTLVPSGNQEALTRAILRYLDDPTLEKDHADALQEYVETRFNMARMIKATSLLYQD